MDSVYGRSFNVGDGDEPEVFTPVATGQYKITIGEIKATHKNTTTHQSSGKETNLAVGMLEMSDIVVVVDGIHGDIASVYNDIDSQRTRPYTIKNYSITWADDDREDSIIKAFPIKIEPMEVSALDGDAFKFTVTYKVADFTNYIYADAAA